LDFGCEWKYYEETDDMSKSLTFALQALLARHEQYMHDAERDRLEMSAKIEQLETDKKALEDKNAKTIEENRGLLDQLEGLNETVTESETHVKSLEATLSSTRQELRRLEVLASRTHDLEVQLAALEQEQELLQRTITTTQEEERSAIQRWRKAERRLYDLQEQLERIEREAREERERHVEVLGRMERRRAVERELDTAAGRLKGAAAATTGNGKNGSNVVSHFVKDILQDNANLQLGIVELREMLMNSNDEVQMLREQLLLHQPVAEDVDDGSRRSTLRTELASKENEPQVISQALHIHHHYHGVVPKKVEVQRPKKKRTSLNTALFTPPKSMSPRTPRSQDTANAILSQTSVTIPAPITPNNRWSVQSGQSDFAPSSVPSSPQSMYRHSGLFDRGFDIDSSRPTSPGSSVDPMSPQFQPHHHRKRGSEVSTRSFANPTSFQPHNIIHEEEDGDVEELPDLHTQPPSLDDDVTASETSRDSEFLNAQEHNDWESPFQPTLRRTTSHESILSIAGLDIHTLKSRPSQMTITGGFLRPRTRLGTPTTVVSMDTTTTAVPTLSRHRHNSTSYLRANILAHSSDAQSISSSGSNEAISSKLGGWVFGKWGASPSKPQQRVASTPIVDPMKAFMGRTPGINQKGPVPGFVKKIEKAPSKVIPEMVNHDALREVLMEGGLP
jgi:outer membrane murein-binding lipoprotein Lpp